MPGSRNPMSDSDGGRMDRATRRETTEEAVARHVLALVREVRRVQMYEMSAPTPDEQKERARELAARFVAARRAGGATGTQRGARDRGRDDGRRLTGNPVPGQKGGATE